MRGFHLPYSKFSLQYLKFSSIYAMGNMLGMFSFVFWVFSTQKCEAVYFPRFESACMHARSLGYLGAPYLIRAHASCMCVCNVHARCDITRFTKKANHVIMMSSAFAFHLCHVRMRWNDVIGVHIA